MDDAMVTAGVSYRKDSVDDKKQFIAARRYMSAHAQARVLKKEVNASSRRLTSARAVVPGVTLDNDGRSRISAYTKSTEYNCAKAFVFMCQLPPLNGISPPLNAKGGGLGSAPCEIQRPRSDPTCTTLRTTTVV